MFRKMLLPAVVCSAFFCATAHAESSTIWDFTVGMEQEAGVQSLTTTEIVEGGLHVQTETDGVIVWSNYPLGSSVDVITIRAQSQHYTEGAILWTPPHSDGNALARLYFSIPADGEFIDINVSMNYYSDWKSNPKAFGLGFPANTDLVIESITFRQWSLGEKIIESWKSFWTTDLFTMRSINFLWGPLISTNPIARANLFATLPPIAWSAMRIIYVILIIVAVGGLVIWARHGVRTPIIILLSGFLVCWIILDIRMGAELVTYATADLREFVFAEKEDKSLRGTTGMYTDTADVLVEMKQYERFTVLSEPETPLPAYLRYMAYPSNIVFEGDDTTGVPLWFIYHRPDIGVDELGRLVQVTQSGELKPLTNPGKIIHEFEDRGFLFTVSP